MAHEFCWIELTTDEPGNARDFYRQLCDWHFDEMPMDNGGTYAMFQPTEGGPGGGIMAKPQADIPTAWMPYIRVDDISATLDRVTSLGGTVCMGQTEVPGHGSFAVISDPQGGVVGLWRCHDQPTS